MGPCPFPPLFLLPQTVELEWKQIVYKHSVFLFCTALLCSTGVTSVVNKLLNYNTSWWTFSWTSACWKKKGPSNKKQQPRVLATFQVNTHIFEIHWIGDVCREILISISKYSKRFVLLCRSVHITTNHNSSIRVHFSVLLTEWNLFKLSFTARGNSRSAFRPFTHCVH